MQVCTALFKYQEWFYSDRAGDIKRTLIEPLQCAANDTASTVQGKDNIKSI